MPDAATQRPATVGILMLETHFPRIPGDIGNAATWPFPVIYRTVPGASPDRVVRRRADGLLEAFADGARDLVRAGAEGITTTCGFLSLLQADLAARCDVPVAASSLMQVPLVDRLLPPGKRAGVLTVSAASLTPAHLRAAGAREDTPVEGTDAEFSRVLLGDEPALDVDAAERDVLAAGERLTARHPEVGALVLECTNMPPYAAALRARLGLPVHDVVSFVRWFQAGLSPARFARGPAS